MIQGYEFPSKLGLYKVVFNPPTCLEIQIENYISALNLLFLLQILKAWNLTRRTKSMRF